VELRAVFQTDYNWIYRTALSAGSIWSWRLAGSTPSPESFPALLWSDVQVQMVATRRGAAEPVALFQLYNSRPEDGTGYVAVMLDEAVAGQGWPHEGTALFLDYVFTSRHLRKVYFEATDLNANSFKSATRWLLVEEGVLKEHRHFDGRYVDLHIYALYRTAWLEQRDRWRAGLADTSS
jgi:RimJ/RimL family protein N-acetyltransferase